VLSFHRSSRRCLLSKRSGTDKPLVGWKLDFAGRQSHRMLGSMPDRPSSRLHRFIDFPDGNWLRPINFRCARRTTPAVNLPPGRIGLSDFFDMGALGITIAGDLFAQIGKCPSVGRVAALLPIPDCPNRNLERERELLLRASMRGDDTRAHS
jgi:hypothetical protein